MNPHETQDLLRLVTALWPRNPISAETADAWAIALTPIDHEIARRAIIDHSRSPEGNWPPTVATIAAAMRNHQRGIRATDCVVDSMRRSTIEAHRDNEWHKRRTRRLNALPARQRELAVAEAMAKIRRETGSPVVPKRLAEKRAAADMGEE